ncbi:hypothetical protein GJV85_00060 [Sulfurimonas aquatica]|uniref:Porin n=1 Tax=Sulfurimonas aquatica TaxID=2672570 RepID=A0A975AY14_9BACT|nr:outer membrane family protein [Sulfurimonas aquatica]QSZ40575.1 hypothetical protein GJV85_00060 [Sulfurimonas aquatica]
MNKLLIVLLLQIHLLAQDYTVWLNTIAHAEAETILPKNNSTDSQTNSSLYSHLSIAYDFNENFYTLLGAKANYIFYEDNYDSTSNLTLRQTSKELNRAMISEASLNYQNKNFTITLGKNDINYDWISGSMDGAIFMYTYGIYSLQTFWAYNYEQLYYNYYAQTKLQTDSSSLEGMFGSIFSIEDRNLQLHLYSYCIENSFTMSGANLAYIYKNFGFNLGYTSLVGDDSSSYAYHESFLDASIEYLYKNHYMALGASLTGENGLYTMLSMGSYIFGNFYLGNQVDRSSAKNSFFKYRYNASKFYLETVVGSSIYNDIFQTDANKLFSREIDLYGGYELNREFSISGGVVYMDVDDRDLLSEDRTMLLLNLVYNYETK